MSVRIPLSGEGGARRGPASDERTVQRNRAWSWRHDNRQVTDLPDEPQVREPTRSRTTVVDVGRSGYPPPFMSGAVTAGIVLAAAIRKVAIFGFGPPS